jgi:predicted MFS family arabinose efflux permease
MFFAIASVGVKTTVWAMAISSVFSASRGLALAVTLSGTALSQVLAPLAAQWLIDGYGWRTAYICLALGWGIPALVLILLFFYDAGDRERRSREPQFGEPTTILQSGLTLGEAFRNVPIIRIMVAVLITTFIVLSITIHAVPMLSEKGIARETAAQIVAASGLAAICGKFSSGWFLDRGGKDWIGALTFALPAAACTMLLSSTPSVSGVALIALGFSTGAYMQVYTYLTGHYAGLRHFGKIFGVIASMVALAAGLGPVAAGRIYDVFGTYDPLFIVCIPGSIVSALLITRLGPFPIWKGTVEEPLLREVAA